MKELTLTLLFLIRDSEVLLAMKKQGFGAGRFNGVGGKLELNETIKQALIRESQEEINITPTKFEQMAEITFDEYFKGEPAIMHVHVFTANKWTGEPLESDEMAPQWFKKTELPFDTMWPDDPYWLPQILDGKKVVAKFKLAKDDKIISHDIKTVEKLEIS